MSIANGPMAAAGKAHSIPDKVSAYIASARSAAANGLTWVEVGELMLGLIRLTVDVLDHVRSLHGQDKKAMVVEYAGRLFDAVADKAVPMALWPVWMLARPAVRSLVLALASGAVEVVLPMVRSS